jgi:hypothetical protein
VAWDRLEGKARGNDRWAAEQRSQELLRSWLSADQCRQYDVFANFEVIGSATGKRYRIHRGTAYNVHELDERGKPTCAWCFTLEGVPTGDVNLAQKVALENFECSALAVANRGEETLWRQIGEPADASHQVWLRRTAACSTSATARGHVMARGYVPPVSTA